MKEADIEYITMGRLQLKNTPIVTVQASRTIPAFYRVTYENNSRKFVLPTVVFFYKDIVLFVIELLHLIHYMKALRFFLCPHIG